MGQRKRGSKGATTAYSGAVRNRAIELLDSGMSSAAVAAKLGCSATSVMNWKRLAGKTRNGRHVSGLPTIQAPIAMRTKKPRPLVATGYSCPHCGGAVELGRMAS